MLYSDRDFDPFVQHLARAAALGELNEGLENTLAAMSSKVVYVSTDVEADGPIPGPNSMLSYRIHGSHSPCVVTDRRPSLARRRIPAKSN